MNRFQADQRAELSLIRLICAASMTRTVLTRIVPIATGASWWIAAACLAPGLIVTALLRLLMTASGASTVTEAFRMALGKFGGGLISLTFALLLLIDGTASMTALITLFTEGLGTRGTQFTLALLTGGVLIFCLNREGLPRAVSILRWLILMAAVTVIAFAAPDMRLTNAYPIMGSGSSNLAEAIRAGFSLAWPMALVLTVPPLPQRRRIRSAVVTGLWPIGAALLIALTLPHEAFSKALSLADSLLLPLHYLPTAVRTLGLCALMLALFLAIAAAALLSSVHLTAPFTKRPKWLHYALLAALPLTQTVRPSSVWRTLSLIEPWLIAPLLALALAALIAALIRRKT